MAKFKFGTLTNKKTKEVTKIEAPWFGIGPMDAIIGSLLTVAGIFMFIGGGHTRGVNDGINGLSDAIQDAGMTIGIPLVSDDKEAE